jgi:hypothetical protein
MHGILYSLFVYIAGICCEANGQIPCDSMMYIDNGKAVLGIQAFGSAITDFRFKGSKINPFTWSLKTSDVPPNNRKSAPFRGISFVWAAGVPPLQGRWLPAFPIMAKPVRSAGR